MAGLVPRLSAQGLGGAGTIEGTVKDPSNAVVVGATVIILNPVTDFTRTAETDGRGHFVFRNLPPNPYHVVATAPGFQTFEQDIDVRSSVPIELAIAVKIAGASETVNVSAAAALVESTPTAHTDLDQKQLERLPIPADSSGLSSAITLAAPGVVADSNGFFHPLGDHAQTQFSIDNQPVTDQQSRTYSNQISLDAVQSMEVMTGVPPAEFGDKDSLVVRVITKSGLEQGKPSGSASFGVSSFETPQGEFSVGLGNERFGNFLTVSVLRGNRFLDSPEFTPLHDTGNSETLFDRFDFRPNDRDTFRLNLSVSRSAFQVPNTYDQQAAGQDQRQRIASFNVAPGWTRIINPALLLSANAYVRQDAVTYSPSANPFADLPATISQERSLTNYGAKVDLSYFKGRHNAKAGAQVSFTSLSEHFQLGLTDPAFNVALRRRERKPRAGRPGDRPVRMPGPGPVAERRVPAGPGRVRPDAGRFAVHLQRQRAHQAAGRLRPGLDHARQGDRDAGRPLRPVRRPHVGDITPAARGPLVPGSAPGPCFAPPTAGRWRRRTTRTSCSRVPRAAAAWRRTRSAPSATPPLQPGRRDQVDVGLQQGDRPMAGHRRRLLLQEDGERATTSTPCSTRRSSSRSRGRSRRSTDSPRASTW